MLWKYVWDAKKLCAIRGRKTIFDGLWKYSRISAMFCFNVNCYILLTLEENLWGRTRYNLFYVDNHDGNFEGISVEGRELGILL